MSEQTPQTTEAWQPMESAPRDGTLLDVRFDPATAERDSVGSLAEFWAPGSTRTRNPAEPVIRNVVLENRHFRPRPIRSMRMPACDMSITLTGWRLANAW